MTNVQVVHVWTKELASTAKENLAVSVLALIREEYVKVGLQVKCVHLPSFYQTCVI